MSDNDWLKYNASEYTVNGVTYRNLEAQVLKNKEDIEAIDVSGLQEDVEQLQTDVEQLQTDVASKQDELIAGNNIQISGNTISATNTTYEAGEGIEIVGNVINATGGGGSTKYHTFSSDLMSYRNGMAYAASLSGTDTAQTLYEEFTNGDLVVLIDNVGVVAFVNKASYNSGTDTYTVGVHGFATYFDYTPPHQFYGRVTSASQTFSDNNWFDLNTDKWVTRTVTLAAADWATGGGGALLTQQVTVTGMTTDATVWVSPAGGSQTSLEDYATYKISCTAQGTGTLSFTSWQTTVPTNDITVIVVFKR